MQLNRKGRLTLNYFRFSRYCALPWSKLNQAILSHNFVTFTEKSEYCKFSLILAGCEWGLSSVKSSESLRGLEVLMTFLDPGAGSGKVSWLWACGSPLYPWEMPISVAGMGCSKWHPGSGTARGTWLSPLPGVAWGPCVKSSWPDTAQRAAAIKVHLSVSQEGYLLELFLKQFDAWLL